MENNNDTFLSDWLADKISDDQLKLLVSNEDFIAFQKLKNTLSNYNVSEPDMQQSFAKIQEKIDVKKTQKQPKVVSLWKYIAVAASLLLFFGLYQLFYFSNKVAADFGSTEIITLNDNSKVTLNAKSELSYPNFFRWNRSLKLEGEAFFEVQKGSKFTVETALGEVTVLGTKFNVTSFDDFFEVVCYEGKVKVDNKDKSTILTQGETVRVYQNSYDNHALINAEKPEWILGESSFKNVPIQYVLEKFEMQFNVKVDYPKTIKNIKFTGSFSNKNRDTAIKTICVPLNIKYTINKETILLTE
jgi:transmembrane sensor